MNTSIRVLVTGSTIGAALLAAVLFVPPVRDKVFTTKLWPWPLPWDTSVAELDLIKELSCPGDVIIESNLHGWQWIALCAATTGTTWVHAALVDENKQLLTVEKAVIQTDFDIYLGWGSTRLAIIRPPYSNDKQIQVAIDHARGQLGTAYDASFNNDSGNCNGLVASALEHAGLEINRKRCCGRLVYAPDCFEKMPGARVIWQSDRDRRGAALVL